MTCRSSTEPLGRPDLLRRLVVQVRREEETVLFVGNDWAEAHHDIEIEDDEGRVLVRRRLPGGGGRAGRRCTRWSRDHLGEDDEPDQVLVGIETDRGPWVQALIAAGYTVYPINPLQVARYRERHGVAGGEVRPRRCARAGRDRPAGPGPPPARGRRLDGGRAGSAGGPGAPDDDLDPATLGEHAALAAAGVLPGRAGGVRRRPRPAATRSPCSPPHPTPTGAAGSPRPGSRRCCARRAGSATSTPARPRSWPRCATEQLPVRPGWSPPTPPACPRWSR